MADLLNKYLLFDITNESYGVPIAKVREVIRFVDITPLNDASSFLKGVINLRGKIIPIIDMRLKFGLKETGYNDRTIFIIVEIPGARDVINIGMAVDSVKDVIDIPEDKLEKAPDIGLKLKSHYLYGIAQMDGKMIMILNIDRILSTEEVIDITSIEENAKVSK
ncbi:MAG: chemotaxis protein CheW [Brevinematales bacterium]|jgi:purine-binding chemotaxis protein CheW